MLKIPAIESWNFEVNSLFCEGILEETGFARGGAGGEAMQVDISHKRFILREMKGAGGGAGEALRGYCHEFVANREPEWYSQKVVASEAAGATRFESSGRSCWQAENAVS